MSTLKKALSLLLAVVMILTSIPLSGFVGMKLPFLPALSAKAEEATDIQNENATDGDADVGLLASGVCGKNLQWQLDNTGTLTISGSGAMDDWHFDVEELPASESEILTAVPEGVTPWYAYLYQIRKVVIEDGVTAIGALAFAHLFNLETVEIADSVTAIGNGAFVFCWSLQHFDFSNINTIGELAFAYCLALQEADFSDDLATIGVDAFALCMQLRSITFPSAFQIPEDYGMDYEIFNILIALETLVNNSETFSVLDGTSMLCFSDVQTARIYAAIYACVTKMEIMGTDLTEAQIVEEINKELGTDYTLSEIIAILENATEGIPPFLTVYCNANSAEHTACQQTGARHILAGESEPHDCFATSGTFGDALAWELDENGTLTISGTGDIPDCGNFMGSSVKAPWTPVRGRVQAVVIEDGVTSIGEQAFIDCYSLTSVSIGNDVTKIDYAAFRNCSALQSVTIPANVTVINSSAFEYCTALTNIVVADDNAIYSSVDGILYNKEQTALLLYPHGKSETSFAIPDGVTSIGEDAFRYCAKLTSITIPDDVTSIGEYAFYQCSALETVTFGENSQLTSIGRYAFAYCYALTSITIPDSVTSIGYDAFYQCSALETVTFGENSQLTSIGDYAFEYCYALTSITIPDSVTSIGQNAFNGCQSLQTVTFGENSKLTTIESDAFIFCYDLQDFTIPDSVTSIGSSAFMHCNSLTSVTIPETVTSIGSEAFAYCSSLTEIIVDKDNTVYSSSDGVLYNKDKTTLVCYPTGKTGSEFTIPDAVTNLASYAFAGCKELTAVTIPDSVTSIGESAFRDCSPLKTVTFGENSQLTSIGNYAFDNCSALENVPFGENSQLTSIGDSAFRYCTKLASIVIPDSVTSIGFGAFEYCSALETVTFGENSQLTSIGNYAFRYCSTLASIAIPDSVTSINYDAFNGCSALQEITILNPDCSIYNSGYTIPSSATIIGFTYSTAQDYATAYNRTFVSLGEAPLEVLASGTCGSNLTWTFDNHRVLTISGTGVMSNYSSSSMPWNSYRSRIKQVIIEDGVTSIGNYAFYGCSKLTSITIPDSVTSISSPAFSGCVALASIVVEDGNENYIAVDDILYNKEQTTLIFYPAGKTNTSFAVPDTVTIIGNYAFSDCTALTTVTFSENSQVERFAYCAFNNCTALTNITIPGSVIYIEAGAFMDCSSITSITIPDSVTYIGDYAFKYCNSLQEITILSTVCYIYPVSETIPSSTIIKAYEGSLAQDYAVEYNRTFAFLGEAPYKVLASGTCGDALTWTFDNHRVLTISGTGAMSAYSSSSMPWYSYIGSIKQVIIEDGVTSIGNYAFYGCRKLTSIAIPDSVTSIGNYAFYNCTALETVTFGENSQLTSIGEYAFAYINNLTNITIPDSVTYIDDYAFKYCNSLQEITILNPDCSISNNSSTIPSSATIIGFENSTAQAYAQNYNRKFEIYTCPHSDAQVHEAVEVTCTTDGYTAGSYCPLCRTWFEGHELIPATGHTIGEISDALDPTCTEQGYKDGICSVCGETIREELPALGHNYSDEWEVQQKLTCTTDGIKVKSCTVCGTKGAGIHITDSNLPKCTGSSYTNSMNKTFPTYSVPGAQKIVLHFSADSYLENSYDKLYVYAGDTVSSANLVGTYTGSLSGLTVTVYASSFTVRMTTDGSVIKYGFVIDSIDWYSSDAFEFTPAPGHSYSEWSTTLEPTCTTSGVQEKVCSVCGDIYQQTISALGHSYENWNTTLAPTCTTSGTEERTCSVCADVQTRSISALGHSYSLSDTIEPTCTTAGYDVYSCERCDSQYNSDTISPRHKDSDNDEFCDFCNEPYAGVLDLVFVIDSTGSMGDEVNVVKNSIQNYANQLAQSNIPYYIALIDYSNDSVNNGLYHYYHVDFDFTNDSGEIKTGISGLSLKGGSDEPAYSALINGLNELHWGDKSVKRVILIGDETPWNEPSSTTGYDYNDAVSSLNEREAIVYTVATGGSDISTFSNLATATNGTYYRSSTANDFSQVLTDIIDSIPESLHIHTYEETGCTATCTQAGVTTFRCSGCGKNISTQTEALGHDYSEDWTVDREPTCALEGSMSRHCIRCNDKTDITPIEKPAHTYESVITDPTCTEDGFTTHTCSVCGDTYADTIVPALGHDEIAHEAQAVTCTEIGWDAYVTCSRCDYTTYEEIAALGHDEIAHDAQAVTCTVIGWDAYVTCSRCDYTTYEEIAAPGHTNAAAVAENNVDPTCTEKGSYDSVVYCSVCNAEISREKKEVAALGHDEIEYEAQAVTCTAIGWDAYVTCSRCDYTTYKEIAVLGHDLPDEWNLVRKPTCTEEGLQVKTCRRCGLSTSESVPETGHSAVRIPAEYPVPCDTYHIATLLKCAKCNNEVTGLFETAENTWQLVLDVTDKCSDNSESTITILFTDEEGVVNTPAKSYKYTTSNAELFGEKTTVTIDIPATQGIPFGFIHTYAIGSLRSFAYNATLYSVDANGNRCKIWTVDYESEKVVFGTRTGTFTTQTNHVGDEFEVITQATCTEDGEMEHICSVCGVREAQVITAVGHNYVASEIPAICTEQGYTVYTCSDCGDTYNDDYTDALGHSYNTTHFEETTDQDGYTLFECVRCTDSYTIPDPAKAVEGLVASGETFKISLSWMKSVEASVTGYEVFRKAPDDTNFILVKTIRSRNATSFTDKDVIPGYEYSYKVRAMKNAITGIFCEPATAIPCSDMSAPRVFELTANVARNETITGNVSFTIKAEDDIGVTSFALFYRLQDTPEWIQIGTAEGSSCSIDFDTTSIADGTYNFKAIAFDAENNVDESGFIRTYRVDNTGPAQVTGLTAIEIFATQATLSWSNVESKDAAYFILYLVETVDGAEHYTVVKDHVSNVTGCYLSELTPETTYTYVVTGVDLYGNTGAYSEPFTLTTLADTTAPVITDLHTPSQRVNNKLVLKGTAEDDYTVTRILLQGSTDGTVWNDLDSITYTDIDSARSFCFELNTETISEGNYLLRAIAYDSFEHNSNNDTNAPYVHYYIDKTAPTPPQGVTAIGQDGYIEIKWSDNQEEDRDKYSVYRADNADGSYKLIASNLNKLNYFDRTVSYQQVYYYKICVTDISGNTSDFSTVVSAASIQDTVKPQILSIAPDATYGISENSKKISVKAFDNNMLYSTTVEYKAATDAEYQLLTFVDNINKNSNIVTAILPIEKHTDGELIHVRAYCTDTSGHTSDIIETQYVVDKTAPTVSGLTTESIENKITLSWNDMSENDLIGFYVYRSTNGSEFINVGSRPVAVSHTYSFTDTAQPDTVCYRVDAVDAAGNRASFFSETITIEKKAVLSAIINGTSYLETGVQEVFSAEDCIADNTIISYEWQFGDGTSSNETTPIKTYTEVGSYEIALTITDAEGNTDTTIKSVTVDERNMLGTVKIRVCDSNGNPLEDMPVYFDLGEESMYTVNTDNNGYATTIMTAGAHTIGAVTYKQDSNKNYQPNHKIVNVLAGATTEETLTLIKGDLIVGDFEIHEMTYDEIVAAGIDTKDPENQMTYAVTTRFTYGESEVCVNYIRNQNTILDISVGYSGGGGSDGGGGNPDIDVQVVSTEKGAEIILVTQITTQISYLKPFYSATLTIGNLADPEYKIVNCWAELDMSEAGGLSVYSHTDMDTTIAGQESSSASWILRGDQPGTYTVTANFNGLLSMFNLPVTRSYSKTVTVRDVSDMISMYYETPSYIFNEPAVNSGYIVVDNPDGEDIKDVLGKQYKYNQTAYYNVGIRNISDTPIYNLKANSFFHIYTLGGDESYDVDLDLMQTLNVANYIERDGERILIDNSEVDVLYPGEMLISYYQCCIFSIYKNEEDKTSSGYVYLEFEEFQNLKQYNQSINLEYKIDNDLFYDYYYADTDEKVVLTYSTSKYQMDKTREYEYSDSYFNQNARSTTYNPELAKISLGLATAGYSDGAYKDGFYDNLESGNYSRATNIMKAYKQLGFDDDIYHNYGVTFSDYSDKIACSMAKKYITNENGETDTLVLMVVRGGNYGSEWTSNFHVGNGSGDHVGFASAANMAESYLQNYIADLQAQGKIKGELNLWMTSYSRGAATTNLMAHSLNKKGQVGTVELNPDNLFVYTYATPMGALNVEASVVDDSNIFNFVSPLDFVPKVALTKWNYGRYGTTVFFSALDSVSSEFAWAEGVRNLYSVSPEQSIILDLIIGLLGIVVPEARIYEEKLQDTVMYAFSLKNSGLQLETFAFVSMIVAYYFTNIKWDAAAITTHVTLLAILVLTVKIIAGLSIEVILKILKDKLKDYFVEAVVDLVFNALSAQMEEFEDYAYTFSFSGIAHAHYPAHYMALLESNGHGITDDIRRWTTKKIVLEIACPVDVQIYDTDNNLLASVVNDEVVVNNIPVAVLGETKYFELQDADYNIVITGNDEGTMDYTAREYENSEKLVRSVCYYDLPVENGIVYQQEIKESEQMSGFDYALTVNNEIIETHYDSAFPKGDAHNITVQNGSAQVEQAVKGESVALYATIEEDNLFVKWICNDDIIIDDATQILTTFVMPDHDVEIIAARESDLLKTLSFDNESISLFVNQSITLPFTFAPMDATYSKFEWSSSDETVLTVNEKGIICAVAPGSADVTLTDVYSGLTDTVTVTVGSTEDCAHTYANEVILQQPTCTADGKKALTCSLCNSVSTVIIPALGHSEEVIPAVPATCTEPGLSESKKCTTCGETLVEQQEIPAPGHTAADPVRENIVGSDCANAGSYDEVVYCAVCNVELSRENKVVDKLDPPTAVFECGDIDGNGQITSADARLALRASVGLESLSEEAAKAADVNGDGTLSSGDARLILRYSVGLENEFPAKKQ